MTLILSSRFRVLDCLINRTDMSRTVRDVQDRIASREGGYICFSNVHTVVTARKDMRLRDITNNSFLSVPDGRPLSLVAKWRRMNDVGQVAGPDFMPYFIQTAKGVRHFFFGSTPETLEKLEANIRRQYPETIIVGGYSPPFDAVSDYEMKKILSIINHARPDVIWVGLGAPKQEYWMAEHWRSLKPAVLMGVGAAFDLGASKVPRAPKWMTKLCVEWLYRLYQEPRRLWKRYLYTNLLFIYYLISDPIFKRKTPQ